MSSGEEALYQHQTDNFLQLAVALPRLASLTIQAGLWNRFPDLNTELDRQTIFSPFKGTVRPDWICMRVVPLESPLKGHQPLFFFDFLISVLNI